MAQSHPKAGRLELFYGTYKLVNDKLKLKLSRKNIVLRETVRKKLFKKLFL